jgi:hypothetical protein
MCGVYVRFALGVCAPSMCACMCASVLGDAGRFLSLRECDDRAHGHQGSCRATAAAHTQQPGTAQRTVRAHRTSQAHIHAPTLPESLQVQPNMRTCTRGQRTATRTYCAHTHCRAHILRRYLSSRLASTLACSLAFALTQRLTPEPAGLAGTAQLAARESLARLFARPQSHLAHKVPGRWCLLRL